MDAAGLITFEIDDGVFLRPFSETDAPAVLDGVLRNYEHLRTFMEWIKPDYSITDAQEFVDRCTNGFSEGSSENFGIFRDETFIGTVGLIYFDWNARVTEIGYWIDAQEEGKGLMTRACTRLIEHALHDLDINRIQIRCASENARSAAIPVRLGFKLEGVQRQHVERSGSVYDFAIYGLLRPEWVRP